MEKGGSYKMEVARDLVAAIDRVFELAGLKEDLPAILDTREIKDLDQRIGVLALECALRDSGWRADLNSPNYSHQAGMYYTYADELTPGAFEWSVPRELRALREEAKMLIRREERCGTPTAALEPIPQKYIELAKHIAEKLEDWANPKDETGLRYEYVGYSKPISIAVVGLDELLQWLHSNRPEEGAFIQLQYDTLMSNAKLDDHLLETLYEHAEVLSEGSAEDLAFALRSIVDMLEGVVVPEPIVAGTEQKDIAGYMSTAHLAKHHGVNAEALRKRLDRHRAKHTLDSDLFIESQDRGKNKPKYLYDAEKVLPIIQELRKQGASIKRPSKTQ